MNSEFNGVVAVWLMGLDLILLTALGDASLFPVTKFLLDSYYFLSKKKH